MTRPRSNALQTGRTIAVDSLPAVASAADYRPGVVYSPAPMNPNFLAAFIKTKRSGHPCQGWKLHVCAYPFNAQQVADAVLPILAGMKIWHKYMKSAMGLSQMTGGQRGKFITIYTRDTDEANPGEETDAVVRALQNVLQGLTGPDIEGERQLGHMIFGRYSFDYTKPGE